MTLSVDHTFSEKFDDKDLPTGYSGTWRLEGDQLVLHATSADELFRDMVGTDLRMTISKFRRNTFVTTVAQDIRLWKRLH